MSRRVVTGLDTEGKSCVVVDGPIQRDHPIVGVAWHTSESPADNVAAPPPSEPPFSLDLMNESGSVFMITEMEPGTGVDDPMWHVTNTVDYIVVLQGEIVLALEAGEARLKAGDFVVDRGVVHAWRNDGQATAVFAAVAVAAKPLGEGRAA